MARDEYISVLQQNNYVLVWKTRRFIKTTRVGVMNLKFDGDSRQRFFDFVGRKIIRVLGLLG